MARKMLIRFRRDTAANWTATNPVLDAGEPGYETNTGKVKIGDGSTAWNSLGYIGPGTPPVSSVFSRTGAVVAVNGDYAGILASFLSGATQASRFVGATTSGAPVSGTFQTGDFVIARDGHIFVCTAGGTPGTWANVGSASGLSAVDSPGATISVTNGSGPTAHLDLPNSGVTAGTYGDGSDIPVITVDAKGRITAISTASVVGGGAVVGSDGWIDDTAETWTYASGSGGGTATFTASGDKRSKYTIGTRIKLTQTTVKYFVVAADPTFAGGNTTVTITAGTDYTLANAAISNNFHSYVGNPQGYPGWFNFAAAATGFSSKTSDTGRFSVSGRICTIQGLIVGTSNATTFTFTLPIAAAQAGTTATVIENNGGIAAGRVDTSTSSTTATVKSTVIGGSFTASGTKALGDGIRYILALIYEI